MENTGITGIDQQAINTLLQAAQIIIENNAAHKPKEPLDVALISVADGARRQGVSQITIRRMIDSGELKAVRFGKSIRLRIRDLDRATKPIKTGYGDDE
jgi:excisionase family DNA binding protein